MVSIHLPSKAPAEDVPALPAPKQILFFDGECVMCNGIVKQLYAMDSEGRLAFASLHGGKAAELRETREDFPKELDTFVFWDDGEVFVRSRAAARAAGYLRFPWSLGSLMRFVPRFIADAVYDFVARNRFKWFGKQDTCWLPPAAGAHRFID